MRRWAGDKGASKRGIERMKWLPIDTAPKEEQPVLLAFDSGRYGDIRRAPVVGFWLDDGKSYGWHHWSHRDKVSDEPIAWQHLPAPFSA